MSTLYDDLVMYGNSDYYGFHMPGHKRNTEIVRVELPYNIDITEIEGFDDLHHAKGILLQAQERAAKVYGAEETHFLINGSTVGILSAILGCTRKGEQVLVARNSHKSVYHAIYLNELKPIYLYSDFCGDVGLNEAVRVEDVAEALERNREISAVIITSPTYDGVVSDIRKIAEVVHKYGIPLIVDEAHGAHFGFHPYFPQNANLLGADVVIHSLHKTLPSLTQTALLHINGGIVDREGIRKYLHMLQTSSPSYVLMASIDACIHLLEEDSGKVFSVYADRLGKLRKELKKLRNLQLAESKVCDPSKLVISVSKTEWSGKQLYQRLLEEYHLQMEMAAGAYVLAMTSVGDTEEGLERLLTALFELDEEIGSEVKKCALENSEYMQLGAEFVRPEYVYSSAEMEKRIRDGRDKNTFYKNIKRLPWTECEGYISTEYAYLYPPGVPLLVPGERFPEGLGILLEKYAEMGFCIEGPKTAGEIEVWTDE